jgi:opacity protein-like surface antigen
MFLRTAAVAAALALTSAAALAAAPVTVHLAPQNHSGETATATLTQIGANTVVSVVTKNGPGLPQPIHIHQGSCAKLNPKPYYPLTTVLDGKSVTTLKGVSLKSLQNGNFAINIHHSTSDIPTYYACGNIPKASAMGSM